MNWNTDVSGDAIILKYFIMNHFMRLAMFNEHVKLKFLSITEIRLASMIIMLKRFKTIERGLQNLVLCEKWTLYKDDDVGKAEFVEDKVSDDRWWDKIDHILSFTESIYDMLRFADINKSSLHLVYDMCDTKIKKVKSVIYWHEGKRDEESFFYDGVHKILVDR